MVIAYDRIVKKINAVRRTVIRALTKNVVLSDDASPAMPFRPSVSKILICRPNHRLGNLLLITPLVQEISDAFPDAKIDLFVKGESALFIFKNYKNINNVICLPRKPLKDFSAYVRGWFRLRDTHYDLAINVVRDSSSGRLATKFAHATFKVFGYTSQTDHPLLPEEFHIARYPVYTIRRYLSKFEWSHEYDKVKSLNLKLDRIEIDRGKNLLDSLIGYNGIGTIALFTYATGEKCYPSSWWIKVYDEIRERFPKYNVVEILPVEKVSALSSYVPTFYSQDVREIAALIANTSIFIGADSGMMHLASASQTPTVGLFSVTDPMAYGPFGNGSVAINTNHVNIDGCIKIVEAILIKGVGGYIAEKDHQPHASRAS